jgi:high-affinity nickel permease
MQILFSEQFDGKGRGFESLRILLGSTLLKHSNRSWTQPVITIFGLGITTASNVLMLDLSLGNGRLTVGCLHSVAFRSFLVVGRVGVELMPQLRGSSPDWRLPD